LPSNGTQPNFGISRILASPLAVRGFHIVPSCALTCAPELCACIEDGLRILAERPFSHYVPDFDWNVVNARMGASPIYQHLVTDNASSDPDEEAGRTVEDVVLQHLDVARSDLSLEVPLTAYGLDSLSAERLAHALRVFAPLTQMQLLGDMSINDIYRSAQAEAAKAAMKS
jgi:hypothetical protein